MQSYFTPLCLTIVAILLPALVACAQKEANIWYFGQNAGLDFNSGSPVALTDGALSTDEGSASIADSSGNLLFYTDGVSVWNRKHLVMPHGKGLAGSYTSTQSALIVPQPGSNTIYYIFTVDAQAGYLGGCACLAYSVIDISLEDGLGDVTSKNIELYAPVTEKLTGVKHANGRDIWLITHQWNSNAFYNYLISDKGINNEPVISRVGSLHKDEDISNGSTLGQMKVSPNGSKIALALYKTIPNLAEVFHFNAADGKVANPISLKIPSQSYIYGVEFFPNSNIVYIAETSNPVNIYQFDLSNDKKLSSEKANIIAENINIELGAMQLATDGKIYISQVNSHHLALISNPNIVGKACSYIDKAMSTSEKLVRNGLPNFLSSYLIPADPILIMPNVFTPNGDKFNEAFKPLETRNVQSYSLSICNRWGQPIFTGSHAERGWKGEGFSPGVYYYFLYYEGVNGNKGSIKGTVSLLR